MLPTGCSLACPPRLRLPPEKVNTPVTSSKRAVRSLPGQLIEQMRQYFPDAEVQGWGPMEGTLGLPNVSGRHAVAATVAAGPRS